jgi:hypothetical protein
MMKGISIILFAVLLCGVSCSKRHSGNVADGNRAAEEAVVERIPDVYTEEEMKSLPREELMREAGKTFYIIADAPVGIIDLLVSLEIHGSDFFCRRAVVFTEDDSGITTYLSIDGSVIRDRLGTKLMDGSKYGHPFYAWKIGRFEKISDGFFIFCYWGSSEFNASSTDPLTMEYDVEKDLIYIWHMDPKDY